MSMTAEKSFEVPQELQKFVVRFTSDEADLKAQRILRRTGDVHYFENGDARIDGRQLAALKAAASKDPTITFDLVSPRPSPISNALRDELKGNPPKR
jgi:hypothetical protein